MSPPRKPTYVIDGSHVSDFAGFVEECNRAFIRSFGGEWNGNWNAFHDYFSWTEGEYVLVWKRFDLASTSLTDDERETAVEIIEYQPHVEFRPE